MALEKYLYLLKSLLPKGDLWDLPSDSNLYQLLHGFADEFERLDEAVQLLDEYAFPQSHIKALEKWEAMLGIIGSGTPQERHRQILAKLQASGSLSKAFYQGLLAQLGYEVVIEDLFPIRTEMAYAGYPVTESEAWRNVWEIKVFNHMDLFLENLIEEIKPAHTKVIIHYA